MNNNALIAMLATIGLDIIQKNNAGSGRAAGSLEMNDYDGLQEKENDNDNY